ncbi:hypothetical protein HPB50_003325 [Hyalomma asiaticum]|uniref:Uncharacterized protein n=1 Tax=Hyalomma asiaticum TaxID=266040 RepID=A0ACB7T539_HYAAI|nr:hypothetical protein HPB50_003325 [Hyalomma asiaticum]
MAFPHLQARRCLSFLAEVLFLAGIIWLLLLTVASLLSAGTQKTSAAEHAGGLLVGLLFVLPAPLLFLVDAICRRTPRAAQATVNLAIYLQDLSLWPAARRRRPAPVQREPSPPSSPGSAEEGGLMVPFPPADSPWWSERPPTYEEAIRMPKFENLQTPRVHQPRVYYHVRAPNNEK